MNLGALIYLLCSLMSVAVAWLLLRAYLKSRTALLLWSTVGFGWLALNNIMLFFDLVVIGADTSLMPFRLGLALASGITLVYGMVWEIE